MSDFSGWRCESDGNYPDQVDKEASREIDSSTEKKKKKYNGQSGVCMWRRCDSGGSSRWSLWTTATSGRKCNGCCWWYRLFSSSSARGDGVGRRLRCYHGFHVLRNSGVSRVSTNGTTVDCEQLRQDDQHVLEHHQFHVSAQLKVCVTRSPFPLRS